MKEKDFISNYMAIKNMSPDEMAYFLDCVYLTGLNDGTYTADNENESDITDNCPYSKEWLERPAEDATQLVFSDDGDAYIPDALKKSVFRIAGINPDNVGSE